MSQPLGDGVIHLIAPDSVASWFCHFAQLTETDRVVPVGEKPEISPSVLASILAGPQRAAVFYSSHDTLHRDLDVAQRLRGHGYVAVTQSPECARIGYDKFAMKQFFDAAHIATPAWVSGGATAALGPPGTPIVIKQRHGTQSVGSRLSAVGAGLLTVGELAENFVDGVEYSVVVYRDEYGTATFPPVWKGRVDRALTPPWRRLRLCPFPDIEATLEHELRTCAAGIVEAAGGHGHVEVELLVDDGQAILVLEINPRVSGTMRISAMATGLPIFSMYRRPESRGHLSATRAAAEIPYDGPPVCDAERGVFATSRLTVAADDFAAVCAKLEAWQQGSTASCREPALRLPDGRA